MYEYEGHDLLKYIEFHYEAYDDKEEFVRFLRYEVLRRQRVLHNRRFFFWVRFPREKDRLRTTMSWVEAEEKRLQSRALAPAPVPEIPLDVLVAGKDELLDKIGSEVSALLQSHMGKIDLYNEHHTTKLIQLLRVLRDLRAPGKKGKLLFKSFSDTDMAAILRQFVVFGDKKTNTLQVKIAEAGSEVDLSDPAVEKLGNALQDFFFS